MLFYNSSTVAWRAHGVKDPSVIIPPASTHRMSTLPPPPFAFAFLSRTCFVLLIHVPSNFHLGSGRQPFPWHGLSSLSSGSGSSSNFLVLPSSYTVGFSLHFWPHCGTLPCPVWSWGYRDSGKALFVPLRRGSIPLESECLCKG